MAEDHAIFELTDSENGNAEKTPKVTTPNMTINISTKDELRAQLDLYARGGGGPAFLRHLLPNRSERKAQFARRHYVKYVRPALRYYCKKFGEKIPDWLKTDELFSTLNRHEMLNLFGVADGLFPVREYEKMEFRKFNKVNNDTQE